MSAYRLAVVLSGGSAALGLLRELLVYWRLGLGTANDQLQFALSITYTIALLGEPLRLASMNLLARRIATSGRLLLAALVVSAAAVTTAAYGADGPSLPRSWVMAAALAGAANLLVSWTIPRRLRDGPFLMVHALTVLPNAVIVAGLLWPAPHDAGFAGRVVLLFLVAPLIQLAGFFLLRRRASPQPGPGAGGAELAQSVGWHGIAAAGGMATQFAIRAALTAVPGTLSAFSLMLRVAETIRAILVDSWVASRVEQWSRQGTGGTIAAAQRLLPQAMAVLLVLGGLLVAVAWPGEAGTLMAPAAVVVLVGIPPQVVYRVAWQAMNASAPARTVLARMAGLEWGVALAGLAGSTLGLQPVAILPWLAYVVRPAAGARIVAASARRGG